MTTINATALAALLALAAATPGNAQDAAEGSAAGASSGASESDLDAMAGDVAAQIADPAPFDAANQRLITSITAAGSLGLDYAEEVGAVDDRTEVVIVELSELRSTGRADLTMLDQSLSGIEDQRDEMRAAIEGEERLIEALASEGHGPGDVVAMVFSTGLDNEVTLVVEADGE